MNHRKKQMGGFVALNTGLIADSYSRVRLRQGLHTVAGGFCGENRGTLDRCAAQGYVRGRGMKSGFCGQQKGRCSRSHWLRDQEGREDKWSDWECSLAREQVAEEDLEGWDFTDVWHLHGDRGPVQLSLYDRPRAQEEPAQVIEISDRRGLLEFARAVNNGEDGRGILYRLTTDIDLGGWAWTPVGWDANVPFEGSFDGGGHLIRNFSILAGKFPLAGFFGRIGKHGVVENLRVDCVLVGKGSAAAPLCAANDGAIVNCAAIFHGEPSHYTGGLVAQNAGRVERCAALGRIGKNLLLPWWIVALLLAALCIPAPAYFALTALAAPGQEVFAPVILDPNAQPVDPEEEMAPDPDTVTDSSASFVMNAEMAVSVENYAGTIGLRCPSWSTRGFVASVRLAEEDARRLGSDGERPILYQSGLIAPGYGVDVITLGALPDGTLLPAGSYELSVLLEFYDMETNEKAAVNTVIPLQVTVH